MNGALLQARLHAGYAKAAKRVGLPFDLYRPNGPNNPLAPGNLIATLPASFRVDDEYKQAQGYGTSVWLAYVDDSITQVGDYLVGDKGPFFIAAQRPLLPVMTVNCTRTLTVLRMAVPDGFGALGYGGNVEGTEIPVLTGWPASVLQGGGGGSNGVGLPSDVSGSVWMVSLPALPGVMIQPSDIVIDDIGRRYIISLSELTDRGWRLTMQQAVT